MGRVILVTGVSGYLGGSLARDLATDPDVDQVIGVDLVPPRQDLGPVRFVPADIRNPVIAKVIVGEDVDTVVHADVLPASGRGGSASSAKETNVIGTMQLLAACQKAPGLRKLVLRSSTEVYGASPRDPAMFTEDMSPKEVPRAGFARDALEVEGYVRGFARRRPDVVVTVLRQATLIGPTVDTAITRYFAYPAVPTVLGFDARLQFCHEQDVLGSLRVAVADDVPGSFNIAGRGILMLSQAIRRLGRPPVPLPSFAIAGVGSLLRSARLVDFPSDLTALLTYGRGVDTTRMREVLGFHPAFSTEEAFADFARTVLPGALSRERVARAENRLRGLHPEEIGHG
ncbi:MAG: NAD-dependent epimerase/dehydratase family protein [Propionibacteriales bacterium]|nr:NAD-dependent epimerase/dehydratase family protein [Propionibacteriales bacterium]